MTDADGQLAGKGGDGWSLWDYRGSGAWPEKWPPVRFARDDESRIIFLMTPPADTGNSLGGLHGGFLASYLETVLGIFVEPFDLPVSTVTISLNIDYPSGGRVNVPLEGEAELLRETGRMMFVRISLRQEGALIAVGNGVLRKVPRT